MQRSVFSQPITVIRDDLRAVQFRELRAETVMKFV